MVGQRYSILERLDAGGMAEVFKGKVSSLQGVEKIVAIKRILPSLTKNPRFVTMFIDEARLSMGLNHANIVQVFDLGAADNTYFIVMEYVHGINLRTLCEACRQVKRPAAVAHSAYIISEVCKGLAHAHTKKDMQGRVLQIVHRDISPPNILLSAEGEVKITDFGLAKAKSQVESTDPGVVKGKFGYLAPESAHGEEVDHRADIFASGILLWELLANRRLFQGASDLETIEAVRRCEIPSLTPLNAQVFPELERIVMKALARRREDRFQSANEFGEALAHYLFSRGMKVTSFDIAQTVGLVLEGKLGEVPDKPQELAMIDQLIQDELDLFRPIDAAVRGGAPEPELYDGSRPLRLEDLSLGNARGSGVRPFPGLGGDNDKTIAEHYGSYRLPPDRTGTPGVPRPVREVGPGPGRVRFIDEHEERKRMTPSPQSGQGGLAPNARGAPESPREALEGSDTGRRRVPPGPAEPSDPGRRRVGSEGRGAGSAPRGMAGATVGQGEGRGILGWVFIIMTLLVILGALALGLARFLNL